MHNMIDPRNCKHFRAKGICPNRDKKLLVYLDNRVISDISLSFEPEMFDKAFEFCASCAHFAPLDQAYEQGQTAH